MTQLLNVKDYFWNTDAPRRLWQDINQNYNWCIRVNDPTGLALPVSFIRREYESELNRKLAPLKDMSFLPVRKLHECQIKVPSDWKHIPKPNSKNKHYYSFANKKDEQGICYYCKKFGLLNEEHLPVYCSGNQKNVLLIGGGFLSNCFYTGVLDFTKLLMIENNEFTDFYCSIYKNGVVENRLCPRCNSSYNFGTEYKAFASAAKFGIQNSINGVVNISIPQSGFVGFLKQILSMFLVNCAGAKFFAEHQPDVIQYIMDKDNKSIWMPPNSKIWFGIYDGPLARRIGIKAIVQEPRVYSYAEISFSPFIFIYSNDNFEFKSLKNLMELNENLFIKIPLIDFKKFDITIDAGFDWNNNCFESFTKDLEMIYYRERY